MQGLEQSVGAWGSSSSFWPLPPVLSAQQRMESRGPSSNLGIEGRGGALSRERKDLLLWALANGKIIRIYRIKCEPAWRLTDLFCHFLDSV